MWHVGRSTSRSSLKWGGGGPRCSRIRVSSSFMCMAKSSRSTYLSRKSGNLSWSVRYDYTGTYLLGSMLTIAAGIYNSLAKQTVPQRTGKLRSRAVVGYLPTYSCFSLFKRICPTKICYKDLYYKYGYTVP